MNKKEIIINNVRDILYESNFDVMSMNEIAIRTGIKKPSLYHYFNSKEELYNTVLLRVTEEERMLFDSICDNIKSEKKDLDYLKSFIEMFFKRNIKNVMILEKEFLNSRGTNIKQEHSNNFESIIETWISLLKKEFGFLPSNFMFLFKSILLHSNNFLLKEHFRDSLNFSNKNLTKCIFETKQNSIDDLYNSINILIKEQSKC